jgi:hypothetical protein
LASGEAKPKAKELAGPPPAGATLLGENALPPDCGAIVTSAGSTEMTCSLKVSSSCGVAPGRTTLAAVAAGAVTSALRL